MKENQKKTLILFMFLWLHVIYSQQIYSQSNCQTALNQQPTSNYQLDTVQTNDTIIWTRFTANSTTVSIVSDSINGLNFHNVIGIELYSGDCNSFSLISSSNSISESPTQMSLFYNQLIVGNNYMAKYLLSNKANAYTGVGIVNIPISSYNWNEDIDCPCECNIIRNFNFDIYSITSFGTDIPEGASPFKNGNVCGWKAALGSPRIWRGSDIGYGGPWLPENTHAYITGITSSYDGIESTEGFYQTVNIKSGVNYNIEFKYMNDWIDWYGVNHLRFVLSNDSIGLGYYSDYTEVLPNNRPTQPIQILFDTIDNTNGWATPKYWNKVNLNFTSNQNFKYLLIYLDFNNIQTPAYGKSRVLLDSILIKPTEDFLLYNVVNDTSICMGDSAYLYGWAHYLSSNPPFANNTFEYEWTPTTNMSSTGTNLTKVAPLQTTTYYLIAKNKIGCKKVDSVTVYINTPEANFSINNDSICAGTPMNFSDLSSCIAGISSYLWNFNDNGSVSTLQNPTHIFSQGGNYLVHLTITDLLGNTYSTSKIVHVFNTPDVPVIEGLPNSCDNTDGIYKIKNPISGIIYDWYIDGVLYQSDTSQIKILFTNYFPNTNQKITLDVVTINSKGCISNATFVVYECCTPFNEATYLNNDTIYNDTILNLDNKPVIINGALVLKNDVAIISINNNNQVYMGPMAKIIIDGQHDISLDNAKIQSGCKFMWDGIYLNNYNSAIKMDNNSIISEALQAINITNGAKAEINNSSLTNNYKCINISNCIYSFSPIELSNSTLFGTNAFLVSPLINTPSLYAIFANNINNLIIGDSTDANNRNDFDGFANSVLIENTNTKIYNNSFKNSSDFSIKIKHRPKLNNVYLTNIGGENNNYSRSNSFEGSKNAIFVQHQQHLNILNNSFSNIGTWNTIELRDIRHSNINIKNNIFDNVKFAFRSYNAYYSNIEITDNVVKNSIFGFGILNTHANEVGKLLIKNNDININDTKVFSRGIQTINIKGKPSIQSIPGTPNLKRAVIDSNNIYINYVNFPSLYPSMRVVGIDVQNCILAYVQNNSIESSTMGDNSKAYKYVGINVENSPNSVFCKNWIYLFGYGVQCTGSSPNSRLVKTVIRAANYGINLENAQIGNQGYTIGNGYTYDNEWDYMYANYKIIGNVSTTTNWYYRNGNTVYSPIPLNIQQGVLHLYNIPNPNSMNCGINTDPSFSISPFEPNDYLHDIIFKKIEFDTLAVPCRYFNNRYAFTIMKNNDELREELFSLDDAYSQFMENINSTDINVFDEFDNSVAKGDFDSCVGILREVSNTDDFAPYEKIADTIFLNTWVKDQYTLSTDECATLKKYAQGNAILFGPAVYTARVMIGLENTSSNARLQNQKIVNKITNKDFISVFPNPSNGIFSIKSTTDIDNGRIEIYSITGQLMDTYKLKIKYTIIDLSHLSQGIYFYRILQDNNITYNGKIIINK